MPRESNMFRSDDDNCINSLWQQVLEKWNGTKIIIHDSAMPLLFLPLKFHKIQSGLQELSRLPQLGFLIFFDKIFLVNLINHNLYRVEISAIFNILIFLGIFSKISAF
jgi:hypothetical protein